MTSAERIAENRRRLAEIQSNSMLEYPTNTGPTTGQPRLTLVFEGNLSRFRVTIEEEELEATA